MQLHTFEHTSSLGWSAPLCCELDSPHTLVLAFGASGLRDNPTALHELSAAFPQACLLGCSTSGEIRGARILDDSLVVAVARFDSTQLRLASSPLQSTQDSFEAGQIIARDLTETRKPRAILLFSDGLCVNGSELLRGVNGITRGEVSVTGGLAGDGDRFKRTWVIYQGQLCESRVAAVGLYGDHLQVGCGSQGGWDIFGPERRVTRSQGNILHELDGKPALALYKQYLGERASGLPATALLFPLALRAHNRDERRLVRTILGVNEADQSMVFAGDVPQGSLAQLMRANFERLIEGATGAARQSLARAPVDGPTLALAVSCIGRRLVLGERAEEEVEVVLNAMPERTQLIGFYSYGEISPLGHGSCELHNQTMTLTTLSES